MTTPDPMARLGEALTIADEALRAAMHAVHDVPAGTAPGDWYDRVGQMHAVTSRAKDLLATVGDQVGRLPAGRLRTIDGTLVTGRIDIAADELAHAALFASRVSRSVSEAWTQLGVLAVRDNPEGGPS